MKLLTSYVNRFFLSVCFVFGCYVTAWGQNDEYYAKAGEDQQGYWNLKTDYTTRSTLVRFYTADSQLVYQESLPNEFVKLTPANVRRLDQTLARLVSNQLVSSTIETSQLPLETRAPQRRIPTKAETNTRAATPEHLSASGPTVRFLPSSSKPGVYLFMQNPALEKVTISIRSDENAILYEQITRSAVEHIFLNMSGMATGKYEVRVVSATKQTQRSVAISYSSRTVVHGITGQEPPAVPAQLVIRK